MSTLMGDEGLVRPRRWLRRYAILILLVTLVGGVTAGVYVAGRSQTYSSSAQLLLRPSVGNPFDPETGSSSQQITIAVATESALVLSDEVLALASDSVGRPLEPGSVSAAVPPNTSTIVVTARSSTAEGARAEAQAVAESFLQYRQRVAERYQEQSGGQLRTQIAAVQRSLAATGRGPAAARRSDVLTAQLVALQSSLVEIQSAPTDPGTLVSLAGPGSRSAIGSTLLVVGGLAAGLLAGIAAAFVLGRRDTSIDAGSDDVVAGVPVLTVAGAGFPPRSPDAAPDADGEECQQLRTFLLASYEPPTVVAIGGVGPADRSGGVALGLGRSITRAGYRVAVVLTSTSEAAPFSEDVVTAAGLDEAVRNELSAVDLLVEHDGVAVLSPGGDLAGPGELLSGRRFRMVVDQLRAGFDYVLVVTGPVSQPAGLAVVRAVDALLLVATEGETSGPQVGEAARRATLVGLPVMGLALRTRSRRSRTKRAAGGASPSSRGPASAPGRRAPEESGTRPEPTTRDRAVGETESPEDGSTPEDRPSIFRW